MAMTTRKGTVAPTPRLTEQEGAGTLARTRREGEAPRSARAEVTALQKQLGVRMPSGYSTFVTKLGEGIYGDLVRVYPPRRLQAELEPWRERLERHWFWGKRPLSQAEAQEAVRIGDTLAGDELVVHPRDPDAIVLLPRDSERARLLARGLAPALAKLVKAKDPVLRPFAPATAPPATAQPKPKEPSVGRRPAAPPRRAPAPPPGRRPAIAPAAAARGAAEASPATRRAITSAATRLAHDELRELLVAHPGVLSADEEDAAWSTELLVAAINGLQSKARLSEVRTPPAVRDARVAEHRATFDLLLEHGADPNGDPAQISPLRQAVLASCPPIVATLVARGADPAIAHPAFGTVLELAEELVEEGGGEAEEAILATLRAPRVRR